MIRTFALYPYGRTLSRIAVSACAMAALSLGGAAQAAPDEASPSQARIILPANLQKDADLVFGSIARRDFGGVVTINASTNAVSKTGNLILVGSDAHRAEFTSRSPIGILLIVRVDPRVTLTHTNKIDKMTATLTSAVDSADLLQIKVLGVPIGLRVLQPEQTIYVGGSLPVAGNQLEGFYEGEFEVTVTFL